MWTWGWGPCGQYRLNKEEGGSMMERDGRPQGPTTPHPLPARPYYTTNWPAKPCIVGAGEDVDVGMGPLWLPVRAHHHISSPYLKCIDHKGSPLLCYEASSQASSSI